MLLVVSGCSSEGSRSCSRSTKPYQHEITFIVPQVTFDSHATFDRLDRGYRNRPSDGLIVELRLYQQSDRITIQNSLPLSPIQALE